MEADELEEVGCGGFEFGFGAVDLRLAVGRRGQ